MRIVDSKINVVITGANICSSVSDNLDEFYDAIYNGKPNFTPINSNLKTSSFIKYCGQYKYCDLSILPDKKIRKAIARRDLYGIICALKAAKNAHITKGQINPERFGIYVGAASVGIHDLEPYFELIHKSFNNPNGYFDSKVFGAELMNTVNPMIMLQTLMNNTLCYSSIFLDARGPNRNYMDLHAAGMHAIKEGFYTIKEQKADVVLCGGVSNFPQFFYSDNILSSGHFAITSNSSINPNELIKPYDKNRCGTIQSEASAFVVLETETHAKKRGVPILAKILSCVSNVDPIRILQEYGSSLFLEKAILNCVRNANIDLNDIGVIIGDGCGSKHTDALEFIAYKKIFKQYKSFIPLVSIKSVIGETVEASGICSIICALKCLDTKIIPPTINYNEHDFGDSNIILSSKSQKLTKDIALVVTRSINGINSCILLQRYIT